MDVIKQAKTSKWQPPIQKALEPLENYIHNEASGGVVLLLATIVALAWANSPWGASYDRFWQMPVNIQIGSFRLAKPLLLWINDGLMAMFFFVVGLEIKRELLVGELAAPRQAILPIAAAVGGMLVPAILYLTFNLGTPTQRGWGIPMATDIAFAVGILALLGDRVPWSLKIFLISLAIVDDLGAVLVIAFFYTSEISWDNLFIGAGFLVALIAANRAGVMHPLVYSILGIGGLWLAFLLSGVHATVAGVLGAMTIPARSRLTPEELLRKGERLLTAFHQSHSEGADILTDQRKASAAKALEISIALAQTPLQRLEHAMQPWVSLVIMPLFALANAGVLLRTDLSTVWSHPASIGIVVGLLVGKPVGIVVVSWICVRAGVAELPGESTWRQMCGVALLAGVGFTMSLFIANLAFREESVLELGKTAILLASLIAGLVGWFLLRTVPPTSD